jgi:outer membrane protein TolC
MISLTALADTITLAQILEQARTSSPEARQSQARLSAAEGQQRRAEGAFDWTLGAETGWERLFVLDAEDGVLRNKLQEIDAWRTTLGVSRQFRNGWTIKPGVSVYAHTDIADAQAFGLTRTRPQVNLTVPLLRGRGDLGEAASRERAATLNYKAAVSLRAFELQTVVTATAVKHWQCLALQQQLAVARADLSFEDAYVAAVDDFVRAGQTDASLYDRVLARQTAQRLQLSGIERAHENCMFELLSPIAQSTAVDATTTIAGELPRPERDRVAALDLDRLVEHALAQRSDLIAARIDADSRRQLTDAARDSERPTLNLNLDTQRVTLSLAQSFGGNTAAGAHQEARAQQEDARIHLEDLTSRTRMEIRQQVLALQEAAEHAPGLDEAVSTLEQLVPDMQKRIELGLATRQDLRAAQQELAAMRNTQIELRLQYATSASLLRLLSGSFDVTSSDPAALCDQLVTLP